MEAAMPALFVAGIILLAAGAGLAWPPAGLLVAGLFAVVVPILHARGEWRSQPER